MLFNYIEMEKVIREKAAEAGNMELAELPYEDMLDLMHEIVKSMDSLDKQKTSSRDRELGDRKR